MRSWRVICVLVSFVGVVLCSRADEPQKYMLRYRFEPEQVMRWTVVQSLSQVTSIRGTTDRVESTSRSTKVWKVRDVAESGNATLIYSVDDVVMTKRQTDYPESFYDSRKSDAEIPPVFRDVAALLKRPLAEITFTPLGHVVKRVALATYAAGTEENRIVVPLPEEPVTVGETWFVPHEIVIPRGDGRVRKLAARHRFTLDSVKTGIATLSFQTQVLTPIGSPKDELEVLDQLTSGTLRLDLDTGTMVSHRTQIDRTIVGFEGGGSSVVYKMQIDECCCGFKTCSICSPKP
ncbi:MAG: hypothetical protein ACRC46_15235 [Thermoguttaceae bacterium]